MVATPYSNIDLHREIEISKIQRKIIFSGLLVVVIMTFAVVMIQRRNMKVIEPENKNPGI